MTTVDCARALTDAALALSNGNKPAAWELLRDTLAYAAGAMCVAPSDVDDAIAMMRGVREACADDRRLA